MGFLLQVVHNVDLQKLPVRFAMVMAPADEADLFHMVATAAAIDDRLLSTTTIKLIQILLFLTTIINGN